MEKDGAEAVRVTVYKTTGGYTVTVSGQGKQTKTEMTKEMIHLSVGAVKEPSGFSVKG